jgi:hypothetical protein
MTVATVEVLVAHGRHITPGVEFTVTHEGRFRFLSYDERGWVNAWGGKPNRYMLRSFAPGRIATVHRTRRLAAVQTPRTRKI